MKKILVVLILFVFGFINVMPQDIPTNHIIIYNEDKSITFNYTEIKFNVEDIEKLKKIFLEIDEIVQTQTKSLRDVRISFGKISDIEIILYKFGTNSLIKFEKENDTAYLYTEKDQKFIDYLEKK